MASSSSSSGWLLALLAASVGVGAAVAVRHDRDRARGRSPQPPTPPRPSPPVTRAPVSPSRVPQGRDTVPTMTTPGNYRPTLASWRPYLVMFGPDLPLPAAEAWEGEESGGNPCAIGGTPPAGAAQPQEYGLSQLNAEDPSNLAIATPQALRTMCGTGPSRAEWERVTRPLTEAERIQHAAAMVAHIRQCRAQARHYVSTWPQVAGTHGELTPDFWRYVKLWHASPALLKVAPQIASKLGRPPTTFAEFQNYADAIGVANHIGAGHQGGTRGYLDAVWLNVARVGQAMEQANKAANV